jgi:SAM-dependent methyltransferase
MTVDPQTTPEFWDEQHRIGHHGNLTGTQPSVELGQLRAAELAKPGARVLNIGLGLGHTTNALIERGCRVSVHDISAVALERFAGRVEAAFLPEDLDRLPDRYFDLALSHLVMQHMNDETLVHQMQHVVRSLGVGGRFAFQFATGWEHAAMGRSFRFPSTVNEALPYCRTLGWMADVVEAAGGTVVFAKMTENFPQYRFAWCVAHVMTANDLPSLRPPNAIYDENFLIEGGAQ